ncbi:MAG: DotU family type IV/VI secretion system protein [Planctomycetota bacterium]|jgi:type VI secretion system protein ImpK|nr:DotU family type IV/VI secretion system protein [Planctomycetota bacterium]
MADASINQTSLVDCCQAFVGLVLTLEQDHADTGADDLKGNGERLLMELERDAQREGVGMLDIDAAKYALAALLDEKVLCSEIAAMADWINEPLQMRLYGTFAAGEEFYNRIDELRRDPGGPRLIALEVYHLCLGLGFKGKFDDKRGEEQRRIVMEQIAEQVQQARGGGSLAPNAYRVATQEEAAEKSWFARLPLWAFPAASLAAVLVVALAMSMLVSSAVSAVRDMVEGG